MTDTRKLARHIVDDFTYELHHSVTDPVLDFTRVSSKEIVKLIDHIQEVIERAACSCGSRVLAPRYHKDDCPMKGVTR
jgi:hypothetical protein